MAVNPKLLVLDEPVSALDVSIQAQIIGLLQNLQREAGLTFVFIAHDLSVVRHVSDRVAVMYLGRIVEQAPRDALFADPRHPYTRALMSAVLEADPVAQRAKPRTVLRGEPPSPSNVPQGCAFHTRCPLATEVCLQQRPLLRPRPGNGVVACHHA
jgi:oligopeptide/dipeptide ABC transporter ATP-binding protein